MSKISSNINQIVASSIADLITNYNIDPIFLKKSIECSIENIQYFFLKKCTECSIEEIEVFYEINKVNINIYFDYCQLFNKLCISRRLNVLQWICSVRNTDLINEELKYDNHVAFRTACKNNYIEIVAFLQSINSKYKIITENNVIVEYWVENDINLCVFYNTPKGLELKTMLNTQEICIDNIDELLEKINNLKIDDMDKSTCSKYGETISDNKLRKSSVSKNIVISLENIGIINKLAWPAHHTTLDIHSNFQCIKYPVGGKFEWHVDMPQFDKHNFTFLIYPPQSVVGGEIVVKSLPTNKKITMSKYLWKIVMFPTGILHRSKEIISGTKTVLKGTAYVRNLPKEFIKTCVLKKEESSSSEELCDCSSSWNGENEDW